METNIKKIRKQIADLGLQRENTYLRISLKNSINGRYKLIGRIRLANTYFEAIEREFQQLLLTPYKEGQYYNEKVRHIYTIINNGKKVTNKTKNYR